RAGRAAHPVRAEGAGRHRGARAAAPQALKRSARYAVRMLEAMGSVPAEALAAIETVVASHRTLEDVVRWGLACSPPRLVERVVVQDEYTHDVAIAFRSGVYLVYDTT